MDLKARVDVNCERKDGKTDGQTDGQKTGCLCHTLLKQVQQKTCLNPYCYKFDGAVFKQPYEEQSYYVKPLGACLPVCKHFFFGITPYSFHQMMPNFCP